MKLKRHDYTICVGATDETGFTIETWFGISGKPINEEQAMRIAEILEPTMTFDCIEITNKGE